jgi:glucose dehydrogenase
MKPNTRKPPAEAAIILVILAAAVILAHEIKDTHRRGSAPGASMPQPTKTSGTITYAAGYAALPPTQGPSIYGGDYHGSRFYDARQITAQNAGTMGVLWATKTEDADASSDPGTGYLRGFECSPIICDNRLIVVTPTEKLEAFNPATGAPLWLFTPKGYAGVDQGSRGAACWNGPSTDPYPHRILYSFMSKLQEIDADTGRPSQWHGFCLRKRYRLASWRNS